MTVKEFAKKINITPSAAYEMLKQDKYKKYVSTVNGVRAVSNSILLEFDIHEQINDKQSIKDNSNEIERLKEEIKELKEVIKLKDSQIAEYTNKFAELASQAQTIANQAQILQAAEKKELPKAKDERKGFFSWLWNK